MLRGSCGRRNRFGQKHPCGCGGWGFGGRQSSWPGKRGRAHVVRVGAFREEVRLSGGGCIMGLGPTQGPRRCSRPQVRPQVLVADPVAMKRIREPGVNGVSIAPFMAMRSAFGTAASTDGSTDASTDAVLESGFMAQYVPCTFGARATHCWVAFGGGCSSVLGCGVWGAHGAARLCNERAGGGSRRSLPRRASYYCAEGAAAAHMRSGCASRVAQGSCRAAVPRSVRIRMPAATGHTRRQGQVLGSLAPSARTWISSPVCAGCA